MKEGERSGAMPEECRSQKKKDLLNMEIEILKSMKKSASNDEVRIIELRLRDLNLRRISVFAPKRPASISPFAVHYQQSTQPQVCYDSMVTGRRPLILQDLANQKLIHEGTITMRKSQDRGSSLQGVDSGVLRDLNGHCDARHGKSVEDCIVSLDSSAMDQLLNMFEEVEDVMPLAPPQEAATPKLAIKKSKPSKPRKNVNDVRPPKEYARLA